MNNTRKNILIWLITLTVLSIVVFKANQQSEYELEQLKNIQVLQKGGFLNMGLTQRGNQWFGSIIT